MKKEDVVKFINDLKNTSSNILHVSHNDLDGYGSSHVVKNYLQNTKNRLVQRNTNYGEIISTIEDNLIHKDTILIITDLNLTADECSSLTKIFEKWIVIDHHKIGKDDNNESLLKDYLDKNYYVDTTFCATKLAYQVFEESDLESTQNLSKLVDVVDTYDLWRKENGILFNYGMLLTQYVYSNPFEASLLKNNYFNWIFTEVLDHIYEQGVCETEMQYPRMFLDFWKTVDNSSFISDDTLPINIKIALMHVPYLMAHISYEDDNTIVYTGISTKITQYAFDELFKTDHCKDKVLINLNTKEGTIAFRSINERANHYAVLCGGGGHPNASGAKLPMIENETYILSLIKILKREQCNAN